MSLETLINEVAFPGNNKKRLKDLLYFIWDLFYFFRNCGNNKKRLKDILLELSGGIEEVLEVYRNNKKRLKDPNCQGIRQHPQQDYATLSEMG